MKKNEFDVVVVGSGPAGSLFSRMVAEKGFSVLILERRKEIGIPVRCGEGIGQLILDMVGIKANSDWAHRIDESQLISKSGVKTVFPGEKDLPGYVIERRMFDKLVALKAVDAGAKLLTGTTVVGYKKGEVTAEFFGKKTTFKGKIIVGADGVESYIARMAGLSKNIHPHELDSCFQYEMKGIKMENPHAIQLYFGSMAPRGYVWIFPKGKDRANVGIGVAGDDPKTAKEYLDEFIGSRKDLKNASITQVSSGNITVTKPLDKMVDDQLMIIGTAARQVSPIHGGGIYEAMLGARIAAKTAISALEKGNFKKNKLMEYQKEWSKKHGKLQLYLYKLRLALEHFTDEDYDYYLKQITPEFLPKLETPQGIMEIMKIFLKRPKFKSLISGLLG